MYAGTLALYISLTRRAAIFPFRVLIIRSKTANPIIGRV